MFARNNERWNAEDAHHNPVSMQYNGVIQAIGVSAPARDAIYFLAPGWQYYELII